MSVPAKKLTISIDDYLRAEERSPVKHEYVNGQLYAMVGSSQGHNIISMNVAQFFHALTKGSSCRTFMADIKVRVEQNNSFYYPDVVVACGPVEAKSYFANDPVLIVEVLSPSTTDTDKREKLAAYRTISTLREYLIVYQDQEKVELHSKDPEENWIQSIIESGDIRLSAVMGTEVKLPISTIYDGIDWP